mmetsp:Transcript_23345/g.56616  ORF Transcript_23345/g.56616 Transcript_23345/m.56616 type:complete len:138 (-) Transcript_23345:77-490(-)
MDTDDECDADIDFETDEIEEFRRSLRKNDNKKPSTTVSIIEMANNIFSDEKSFSTHPNCCNLLLIAVCVPMVTVHCERGFSALDRIKSKFRARMNDDLLDALMRISLEGPVMKDFNPEPVFNLWLKSGSRRLFESHN